MLKKNQCLKNLDLFRNSLGVENAIELIESVKHNIKHVRNSDFLTEAGITAHLLILNGHHPHFLLSSSHWKVVSHSVHYI